MKTSLIGQRVADFLKSQPPFELFSETDLDPRGGARELAQDGLLNHDARSMAHRLAGDHPVLKFAICWDCEKWPYVILAGALMSMPFLLLYLIGSPGSQYWSAILVALNFAAVAALHKGRRGLSVMLVIPYTCVVFWVGYAVYTQNAQLEDSEYEEMHGPIEFGVSSGSE